MRDSVQPFAFRLSTQTQGIATTIAAFASFVCKQSFPPSQSDSHSLPTASVGEPACAQMPNLALCAATLILPFSTQLAPRPRSVRCVRADAAPGLCVRAPDPEPLALLRLPGLHQHGRQRRLLHGRLGGALRRRRRVRTHCAAGTRAHVHESPENGA
eukprot:4761906-Pleurochrysis_carterae.AAC.1